MGNYYGYFSLFVREHFFCNKLHIYVANQLLLGFFSEYFFFYLSSNEIHALAVVGGVEFISRRDLYWEAVRVVGLRSTVTAFGSFFGYRILNKSKV